MLHVGERLKEGRLVRGVSLNEIANKTRISVRYLEALEKGDWKQLPGAIFARSFARQYADCVGLDITPFEDELRERFANEEVTLAAPFRQRPVERAPIRMRPLAEVASELIGAFDERIWQRMPKAVLSLGAVLAVCSVVYVGWERVILNGKPTTASLIAGSPLTKLPVDKTLAAASEASRERQATSAAHTLSGQTSAIELQVPPGDGNNKAVRIVASQETWVSITANGKPLFKGILQPSDVRLMKGVSTAKMVIGNAGGVEVETDGRPLGPIGPQGQVRVLLITPNGPKVVRTQDLVKTEPGAADSQT